MRPSIAVRLAGAGCALWLAAACSGAASNPGSLKVAGQSVPTGQLSAIAEAVCRAAGQAPADPAGAGQTFLGEAHDGIHLIARGLQGVNRRESAEILVAKQAVEADIMSQADGSRLAADLERLAVATRTGLARLGLSVAPCVYPSPSPEPGRG